uniref:Uncharacterized protein n=1 Tax=Anguilla anguilla TaxID=7936 RepID=A0A0E9QPX3_ANGAN
MGHVVTHPHPHTTLRQGAALPDLV